jgi:hypothetical protein
VTEHDDLPDPSVGGLDSDEVSHPDEREVGLLLVVGDLVSLPTLATRTCPAAFTTTRRRACLSTPRTVSPPPEPHR